MDLLLVERGVVAQQLVLAAVEAGDDGFDVVLRRLVAAEVVVDLVAEGDLAEIDKTALWDEGA